MGNRSFGIFRRLSDHLGLRHHASACRTVSVSKWPEGKYWNRWSVGGVWTGKEGNPSLSYILLYQSLCHVSSESLRWCHGSPSYPINCLLYECSPHDFPGIFSSSEVFFGSNICGSDIGPPIKSQSHIITFPGKEDLGRYLLWARSYPSKRSVNATNKNPRIWSH